MGEARAREPMILSGSCLYYRPNVQSLPGRITLHLLFCLEKSQRKMAKIRLI